MLEELNLPKVAVSFFAPPGSFGSAGNITQVYGMYSATQRSACLQFLFKDTIQTEFSNGFHCVWSHNGEVVEGNKDCQALCPGHILQ